MCTRRNYNSSCVWDLFANQTVIFFERLFNAIFFALFQPEEKEISTASNTPAAKTSAAPALSSVGGGGGGDMMSEMAKRLQARKAKAEAPPAVVSHLIR